MFGKKLNDDLFLSANWEMLKHNGIIETVTRKILVN